MSNPGVIKLVNKIIGKYHVWLDDNIGESIHLHINNIRIDFKLPEFIHLCDELEILLTKFIGIEGFNVGSFEGRFLNQIADLIAGIDKIKSVKRQLATLRVPEDGNPTYLCDSYRVKALKGTVDICNTSERKSNFYNQTNKDRLDSALEFIKNNGYPFDNRYIIVDGRTDIIMDGWHRASCLYYLYGNIEVPILELHFKSGKTPCSSAFPINRIKKGSKVILYGAGELGKRIFRDCVVNNYSKIVSWIDTNHEKIRSVDGFLISSIDDLINNTFDYIIICIHDIQIKREVYDLLTSMGITEDKII